MQNFVIRPMTWPVLRLFSRSPLIRVSDRIEAAVVTLAVLFVVIATACAGVAGTMIHDVQTQKYLEQQQTRHAIVARAFDDSEPAASPEAASYTVLSGWRFNGTNHTELIGWTNFVKAGDSLNIWVDDRGNRVAPPRPVARAAVDALSAAVVGWFIVIAGHRTRGKRRARAREQDAGRSVGAGHPRTRRRGRRTYQSSAVI